MAQKDFLDKSGLTYLWSKLKGKLATKADLVDGKITTSQLPSSTVTSTSSMPIIRLVRIFDTQRSMYFDNFDNTLKIKVEVLAGKLQTGDQIVLCQRKRSYSKKKSSMEHKWQSMIYKTITNSEIVNNRYVTFELTPDDFDNEGVGWLLYRTNTTRAGALRCVRIRRGYTIGGGDTENNKCLVSNAATFTARKDITGYFVFDF